MTPFVFDENEIRKTIAVLHPDGQIFEVRLINSTNAKWNMAGVFNDVDTLIEALKSPEILPGANAYMTLNDLDEACYDRAHRNKFVKGASPTVSDNDVIGYGWLMVDVDPKRPTGTSSTREQLIASRATARQIYSFLHDRGWPDPVIAHSGNGTHLLYKTQIDVSEKALIKNVLTTLSMLFADDNMLVDLTTFNPSRICKLYGTVARKGASTEKRPHRMSKIINVPERIEKVSIEQLEALVKLLPQQEAPQPYNSYNPAAFDLQKWIDEHGVQVTEKQSWSGGTKWILDCCPFNPQHNHKDAAIIQTTDGKICFNCFHSSCADKKWREFRLHFEPDAYQPKDPMPATPNYLASKPADFGKKKIDVETGTVEMPDEPEEHRLPVWLTTEEIRAREVPPEAHIKTGILGIDNRMMGLKKGYVTVLSGLRSAGKSSVLSQLVIECRQQGMKCALFSGEMIDKQVLKWLTLQAAGKNHVHPTNYERVFYPNDDAAENISKWLNEFVYIYNNDYGNKFIDLERSLIRVVQEKQLDLVLIDNLMALNVEELDRDQYARHTKFVKELKRIAVVLNIHILFVAHPRKSNGYLRMDDISGSGDLSNAADNVFIIHRVDEDYKQATQQFFRWKADNELYRADNVIEICKDRDHGYRDTYIPLFFEPATKRLMNARDEFKHYGWETDALQNPDGYIVVDDEVPF